MATLWESSHWTPHKGPRQPHLWSGKPSPARLRTKPSATPGSKLSPSSSIRRSAASDMNLNDEDLQNSRLCLWYIDRGTDDRSLLAQFRFRIPTLTNSRRTSTIGRSRRCSSMKKHDERRCCPQVNSRPEFASRDRPMRAGVRRVTRVDFRALTGREENTVRGGG